MKYDKRLSVIIVNYNVRLFLEQCLLSVRAAARGLEMETIVVDNRSTDGSVAYLRPRFPEVTFIENTDNPGFAKANNQALESCRGEYILFLNPDTAIGENCLNRLCSFMDAHPEAGAAGVKMIDGTGVFLPESKRSFPSPWVSFCKLFGLSRLFPSSKLFARYSLPYLHPDERHRVEALAGAFLFVRQAVLNRTGGFDESFFMYGEDIDLSCRIVREGYANYYLPERILHYKGESSRRNNQQSIRAFYGAMLIFFRKYYPQSGWFMKRLVSAAIAFKTYEASLLGRKDRATCVPKKKTRRLLIVCKTDSLEAIQESCKGNALLSKVAFSHWNAEDRKRENEGIPPLVRMQGVSDVLFSYPDMPFEQMIQWMDDTPDTSITYHIYHHANRQIISPGMQ